MRRRKSRNRKIWKTHGIEEGRNNSNKKNANKILSEILQVREWNRILIRQ